MRPPAAPYLPISPSPYDHGTNDPRAIGVGGIFFRFLRNGRAILRSHGPKLGLERTAVVDEKQRRSVLGIVQGHDVGRSRRPALVLVPPALPPRDTFLGPQRVVVLEDVHGLPALPGAAGVE